MAQELHDCDRRAGASRPGPSGGSPLTAAQIYARSDQSCRLQIERLARHGGPDLSDVRGCRILSSLQDSLRGLSEPAPGDQPSERGAAVPAQKGQNMADDNESAKSSTTGPYDHFFEDHIIEHSIYPAKFEYADGSFPPQPDNILDMRRMLYQPRDDLPACPRPQAAFENFWRKTMSSLSEAQVAEFIMPFVEGPVIDTRGGGRYLTNLNPLTDGSIEPAQPDLYVGAPRLSLDDRVRVKLDGFIVPTKQAENPIVPNFFTQIKGHGGSETVAARQACYHGTLAARGYHRLQTWVADEDEETILNKIAYVISCTYHLGMLRIYTCHPIAPTEDDAGIGYTTTLVRSFVLTDTPWSFEQGVTAYRNARDWARRRRDEIITLANAKAARLYGGNRFSEEPTSSLGAEIGARIGTGAATVPQAVEQQQQQPSQAGPNRPRSQDDDVILIDGSDTVVEIVDPLPLNHLRNRRLRSGRRSQIPCSDKRAATSADDNKKRHKRNKR